MNVSPRTLAKGTWEPESGRVTMKAAYEWKVGQLVDVEKRTWAGINKPGGHGKITNVYVAADGVVTLDIKYIIGIGSDFKLDASYVRPYQEPTSRGVRSRRPVSLQENNNNNNKENKKQPTKKMVERQMNKTKKEPPQKEQPKRALSLPQILRPKKKKTLTKEGRKKRHSVDVTEAMSEEDDPQTTLPCGVPRVIACEKVTFLSPLNDYSRMTCRPRQEEEDVWEKEDDSVSSFGDDDDKEDFVQQTENGVTTIVASTSAKSPISRTKPLIRGDLPQVESTTRVQQPTKLERIQQAQVHVAQTFVKEVVQHTRSDEPPKAPEESNEREDHFCSALYYVLDLNDGLVPEDELLRLVNERWMVEQPSDGGPPFDETEIGVYMESLLSKNRIMQADGVVVLI